MSIKDGWRSLLAHHRLFLAAFAAPLLGAAGVLAFMPPTYEAAAKVVLEEPDKSVASLKERAFVMPAYPSVSAFSNPLDTQAEWLKSATLLAPVIRALDLRDSRTREPLSPQAFLRRAKVTTIKGTDVLKLSFRDRDPALATRVADAWARAFQAEHQARRQRESGGAARFVAQQVEQSRAALARAEAALRDFKRAHATVDLTDETRLAVQAAADAEAQAYQLEAERVAAEARAGALRRRIGLGASQAMAASALSQSPRLQSLKSQLLEIETSPLLTDGTLTAAHPDVLKLRTRAERLRRTLAAESAAQLGRALSAGELGRELDPLRRALTEELVRAEVEALGQRTRQEASLARLASLKRRFGGLPDKAYRLAGLEREASLAAEVYKMLVLKHEEARVAEALRIGDVRILESGQVPGAPLSPKPRETMLTGLALGLIAGLTALALRGHFDERIARIEDAESLLGAPTLGVLPWLPSAVKARLVVATEPGSPAAEAYRTMRTRLKFLLEGRPKVLAATSAGAGEGKSTTTANLALAFAQSGKRVLLIDADFRKPTLHQLFELPNAVGLSSVLAGQRSFRSAVRRFGDQLDVLTSGPLPPRPGDLLEAEALDALLQGLRADYDLVLIDAPPVLALADVPILAPRVDGWILVIGLGRVSRQAARQALRQLEESAGKVWGAALHGWRALHNGDYQAAYRTAPAVRERAS